MVRKDIQLTDEQYIGALKRLLEWIEDGVERYADDCTIPGMKHTHCTWGLCSHDREIWPDPELHLWPDQFKSGNRIAPKYRAKHHMCPMDWRDPRGPLFNGCFYTCRIFRGKTEVTREEAIELYVATIKRAEEELCAKE